MDPDSGAANDNGFLFRFDDGHWIYNLSTRDLAPGNYVITLEMPDTRRWTGAFVLR
jgi:hypothetical protein